MTNKVAIHEKLMTVRLNCHFGLSNRITAKDLTEEINNDKQTRSLLVKKERFPDKTGEYLNALTAELQKFYLYHEKVTLSAINKGERLLPIAFYLDYITEFNTARPIIQDKYQDFEDHYDWSIQMVKNHPEHGKTFKAEDYPDKSELPKYLKFKVQTLPLPEASTLLNVVGESVQADVDMYLEEAVSQAFMDVNERIKKGLERMVEQLSDPKKKVYDSMQESMLELVSYIPTFNVTDDDSLTLLAAEIKDKILVHKTDALRHDANTRQNVAQEAADILRRMGV